MHITDVFYGETLIFADQLAEENIFRLLQGYIFNTIQFGLLFYFEQILRNFPACAGFVFCFNANCFISSALLQKIFLQPYLALGSLEVPNLSEGESSA